MQLHFVLLNCKFFRREPVLFIRHSSPIVLSPVCSHGCGNTATKRKGFAAGRERDFIAGAQHWDAVSGIFTLHSATSSRVCDGTEPFRENAAITVMRAPSASLLTAPSCAGWSRTGGMGWHPEGPGKASEVGLCETREVQQGQVQGAVPGSGPSPVSVQPG